MGKIIIDQRILGTETFQQICFIHAGNICLSRNYDSEKTASIDKQLMEAKNPIEFKMIYEKYFGDEIKLKLL